MRRVSGAVFHAESEFARAAPVFVRDHGPWRCFCGAARVAGAGVVVAGALFAWRRQLGGRAGAADAVVVGALFARSCPRGLKCAHRLLVSVLSPAVVAVRRVAGSAVLPSAGWRLVFGRCACVGAPFVRSVLLVLPSPCRCLLIGVLPARCSPGAGVLAGGRC